MTTERIDIQIRDDGSVVVKRNLDEIAKSAEKTASGVDMLKNALYGIGAALALDKLRQYLDSWSSINGILAIATKNHDEQIAVQEKLYQVSQRTRMGLSDTVELYGRINRAGKDLGASQNQMIQFTEGVGMALAIQHTSTTQAAGALLQLGQALTGSKIQAQEYNSLIDGAPVILQTVAKHIEGTGGTIGGLTKLVRDGKVTNKEFFDAFLAGSQDLATDFQKASMTIGQGMTIVGNAMAKYLGKLDHSIGLSQSFGQVCKWVSENIDGIAISLAAAAVALAVFMAPAVVTSFASAMTSLFNIIAANPYLALAAAIAAAITLLYGFRDQITVGIDDVTSLGDVCRAFSEQLQSAWGTLAEFTGGVWDGITSLTLSALDSLTGKTEDSADSWTKSYTGFYDGVGTGFAGMARGIARTIDAIAGLLTGLAIAAGRSLGGIPQAVTEIFNRTYNIVTGIIEDMINTVINGVNKLRALVGNELLDNVKFEKANVDENYFKQWGTDIASSVNDGFEQQGGFLEQWVNGVFDRAQEIGKKRVSEAANKPSVNLDTKGVAVKHGDDAKEIEKLQNALRQLLDKVDPVNGALMEQAKALKILEEAHQKLGLSEEKRAYYAERVRKHYQDLIDPMSAMNRELDKEINLLNLDANAREIQSQLQTKTNELEKAGVTMTKAQTEALKDKLQVLQDMKRVSAAEDQFRAGTQQQKNLDFNTSLTAMQNVVNDPNSGATKNDMINNLSQQNPDLFAGTQEAINANIASYQNMYMQIDQMRNANIISEQTADQMRLKVKNQMDQQMLQNSSQFFGNLSVLTQSGNKKVAAIGKAAAMTQATIDGYLAIQKALASAPPPINFALAASVGVVTAANIAKIAGIGFATGGSFVVGGAGGVDSQTVAFRASPGEQVSVSTPTQVRKGSEGGEKSSQAQAPSGGVKVINVVDPNLLHDYLNSADGERVLMNTLQRNQRGLQTIMNG